MPVRMVDLAAVGAAAGAVALMSLPSTVRAIALVVFIAVGPGAAVLTWVRIPRRALLSTVPVLGMAIVTLVAITAMWSYRWNPALILWAQVVGVGGSSAYWYYQHRDSILTAARRWQWRRVGQPRWLRKGVVRSYLSLILSTIAVVVWAVDVPDLADVDASYYSLLLSKVVPAVVISVVLCASALLVAVRQRQLMPAAVAVMSAIIVARVTTVLTTKVPFYDWTYKHLAVVDYIMVHGHIQPDSTDIYAQWAAFFTTWAWFCDVTGIPAMTVAHAFVPAMHVMMALTVYTGARVLGRSRRTALTAAFIAEIVNWVGQDYFSPQAWTIALVFGMFALLLASPHSRACGVLAIPLFAATVPTHQLTPLWATGATCLLCLFRRAKPWWVALVMVLIAVCYLLLNLEALAPYGLFSGGSPIESASTNFVASGLPAKDFTAAVVRGLTMIVVFSAFVCAVWTWRRKRPVLALAVLAFSSFGLLLGQSYGDQAIFRVYTYSILGCSLLIAPAVVVAIDGVRGRGRAPARAAAVLGVTGASVAGLHGYVALWPPVYETQSQIGLMGTLIRDADLRTRVAGVRLGGMPTRLNAGNVDIREGASVVTWSSASNGQGAIRDYGDFGSTPSTTFRHT